MKENVITGKNLSLGRSTNLNVNITASINYLGSSTLTTLNA